MYTIKDLDISINDNVLTVHLGEIEKKIPWENEDLNSRFYIYECPSDHIDYERVVIEEGKTLFKANSNRGIYITKRLKSVFHLKQRQLFTFFTEKNLVYVGIWSNLKDVYDDVDNVYLNDKTIGKVIRPFRFWKLKSIGVIKIPNDKIIAENSIHSRVGIGDSQGNNIQLKPGWKYIRKRILAKKRFDDLIVIVHSIKGKSKISITKLPYSAEYSSICTLKNYAALMVALLSKPFSKLINIVLLYEKKTGKASESGWYIFKKIMEMPDRKATPYFIIDKESPDFQAAYDQYPDNVIPKYSFRHFLYIYLCRYFISSELSNHVMNPRLIMPGLNRAICRKPLVFLQHGIMFSKPIENPNAQGFRKDNPGINIYKSVISSELEATEFYKVGFERSDLIKSGLPKFDISKRNPNSNKIVLMLTYRFWEEAIMQDQSRIHETTYYQTYMQLIEAFKNHNLLDRLIISCHPIFADCILKGAPEYRNLVTEDVNKALEECAIYITDYSSASYDAHYRGSYVIYYWADRDYLIENYKAEPPINETNCDGVPVFSIEELMQEIKRADQNHYIMDSFHEENYKKINEFHDNKNGDRLIKALQELDIL